MKRYRLHRLLSVWHNRMMRAERLGLTTREAEVLQACATGEDENAMAIQLGISHHTVRRHKEKIFEKFDVKSNLAAVVVGIKEGIVDVYEAYDRVKEVTGCPEPHELRGGDGLKHK